MVIKKYLPLASLVICVILFYSSSVKAEERKVIPSIGLQQEYIDNIFWEDDNEQDDYIFTVSPGLELAQRSERLDASIKAFLDIVTYFDLNELDAVDQDYLGNVRYGLTPTINVSGKAQYVKDSRTDRDIATTGLALGTSRRNRQHYKVGGDWAFTEKSKVDLSYFYDEDDYDNPRFTDYNAHSVNLNLNHNLSTFFPSTVGLMNFGYTYYDFTSTTDLLPSVELSSTADYYSLTLGADKQFTELFSVLAYVGPRYTRLEFENVTATLLPPFFALTEDSSDDWGVAAKVDLKYKGEVTRASLAFVQDVLPASGRQNSSLTERRSIIFWINRRFTEKFRGSLNARFFSNENTADISTFQNIDENQFHISPRLYYEFTRDITLEGRYSYTFIDNKVRDQNIHRNKALIRLVFAYPLFE